MADMTISQALRQVKKLKGQLAELQTRAHSSVSYKKGSSPAFPFNATMEKMAAVRSELVALESHIAVANAITPLTSGSTTMPLVQAVRLLQELKGQIAWMRGLPSRAQAETEDISFEYNDDMKRIPTSSMWICDLPEAARASKVEELQDLFDILNGAVENLNHITPV